MLGREKATEKEAGILKKEIVGVRDQLILVFHKVFSKLLFCYDFSCPNIIPYIYYKNEEICAWISICLTFIANSKTFISEIIDWSSSN